MIIDSSISSSKVHNLMNDAISIEHSEIHTDGERDAERILDVPKNKSVGKDKEEDCGKESEDFAGDCHGGWR
jgi:hypothetical protein